METYRYMDNLADEKTREFLSGLDRSSIGKYALSDELIAIGVKLAILSRMNRQFWQEDMGLEDSSPETYASSDLVSDLRHRTNNEAGYDIVEYLIGEVAFWGLGHEWFEANFWHPEDYTVSFARLKMLRAVANSPVEFHEFFEHDIWDYDVITGCVANGIDAMMATRLKAA